MTTRFRKGLERCASRRFVTAVASGQMLCPRFFLSKFLCLKRTFSWAFPESSKCMVNGGEGWGVICGVTALLAMLWPWARVIFGISEMEATQALICELWRSMGSGGQVYVGVTCLVRTKPVKNTFHKERGICIPKPRIF